MGARWPDSWEWAKIHSGLYQVEGYEIERLQQSRWAVRHRVEDRFLPQSPFFSLSEAIAGVAEDMRVRVHVRV